jgi:hypothetical protein
MVSRTPRTDEELREVGGHVLWHVQQMCFLAAHLEERQGGFRITRFDHPLDAAALEAFLVHVRALADFLWCERARPDDGAAVDFFYDQPTRWTVTKWPRWYERIRNEIGYGVLHVSYKRQALNRWTWKHRELTHRMVRRLDVFANRVPQRRLDPSWHQRFREYTGPVRALLPRDGRPVGTPMIAHYRNPPPPKS